ncbi:MAG: signal peptidase I [Elusimicrobiaceae bacterium]|nr:signal peptidase I [Elusimicrobiaceae bacterium]
MEQRLFLVACIMYAFSLATRWLKKKGKLTSPVSFAGWHAAYLLFILSCAFYMLLFIMGGGAGENISLFKVVLCSVVVVLAAGYGYISVLKAQLEQKEVVMKKDLEWCNTVYFAGFVASFVMFFFIQAFKIPSESMQNTLLVGDNLFVNKAAYGFRIPLTNIRFGEFSQIKPGDIIVFRFPAKDRKQINCGDSQYGRDFVKRVIAMPGDTVEVKEGQLFVNGNKVPLQGYERYENIARVPYRPEEDLEMYQQVWENHELDNYYGMYLRDNFGPVKVPENHYFGMGDNRDNSCDSRFWGPIPRENIKGKAWFIHWPFSRMRIIK